MSVRVYDDLGWDWGLRKVDSKTVDVRKMSLLREAKICLTHGRCNHIATATRRVRVLRFSLTRHVSDFSANLILRSLT